MIEQKQGLPSFGRSFFARAPCAGAPLRGVRIDRTILGLEVNAEVCCEDAKKLEADESILQ